MEENSCIIVMNPIRSRYLESRLTALLELF